MQKLQSHSHKEKWRRMILVALFEVISMVLFELFLSNDDKNHNKTRSKTIFRQIESFSSPLARE
jgi:hypothetical protein